MEWIAKGKQSGNFFKYIVLFLEKFANTLITVSSLFQTFQLGVTLSQQQLTTTMATLLLFPFTEGIA